MRLCLILITIVLIFSFCKKKKDPIILIENQYLAGAYTYGDFYVDLYDHNDLFFGLTLNYSATFYKYPMNELQQTPDLFYVKYNSIPLKYDPQWQGYTQDNSAGIPNDLYHAFANSNFTFIEKNSNIEMQINETDPALPNFTFSFNDTLHIDRSVINTFTVNNNTTNYNGSISIGEYDRAISQGVSKINLYPDDVKDLNIGINNYLTIVFNKRKKVVSAMGRTYFLNLRILASYPVKIIN